MKNKVYIYILLVFMTAIAWSCKSKCPLPSCNIRMEHRHALNFKNSKSFKKAQKQEAKLAKKEEEDRIKATEDSLVTVAEKEKQLQDLDAAHDKELKEVKVVEEQTTNKEEVTVESEITKKKKKPKKNKKEKPEEQGEDEINEELVSTDKAAKKELKAAEKESRKLQKESDEATAIEEAENKESETVYTSRKIPWWKRNQKPKVGEDYNLPERKDKKGKTEYVW